MMHRWPAVVGVFLVIVTAGRLPAATLDVVDEVRSLARLTDTTATVAGQAALHLSDAQSPLLRSRVELQGPDAWLFFDGIRPSRVVADWIGQIDVDGRAARPGENCRVVQYLQGTVVIPHGPDFEPLTIYSDPNLAGASMKLGLYTVYDEFQTRSGNLNDAISSFRLKRGYMATLAENRDGTGFSKVFVAQDFDVVVRQLPPELDDAVSFVRVFPWRWVAKKGWAGGGSEPSEKLGVLWQYDWDNVATSTLDTEYVPMRHNANWNAYANIDNKRGSTHVLAFNEPDRPDQANMTVDQVLDQWPNLLRSGLRLGSPAPSDGGLSWLYEFIDRADALGYRVDFVAVHYYQGGQSAQSYYNWLKAVHERTGRPLWITEFNNGANWTCCTPTLGQNAQAIGEFIDMLDQAPFVERYAIYNWVGSTRELITGGTLTPAGQVYRDHPSAMAYTQAPNIGLGASARYRFDGDGRDASGHFNDAVVVSGEFLTDARDPGGQVLSLDGQAGYVQLPENLSHAVDFTFAAWVRWDGGAAWQRIFDFGRGQSAYMFLTPRSGGNTFRFAITMQGWSQEQRLQTATALPSGVWTHVAVTLQGGTGRLYRDGALVDEGPVSLDPVDLQARSNTLGRSQFAADPLFRGRIDDVVIEDRALTATEIAALAQEAQAGGSGRR